MDPLEPAAPDLGAAPFSLVATIRPQAFGTAPAERLVDPLVEPGWPGLRVLAAAAGGAAALFDDGAPLDGHEALRTALASTLARTADGAILDGYLTKQVVADDRQVYTGPDDLPSAGRLVAQSMVGVRRDRAEEAAQRLEQEQAARTFGEQDPVNLVLVDLLWLDGEWLLDVPLQERKRLLDAVVPGDELVRPGLWVRPPLPTWIGSWRAQGFTAITYKAANSRYRPGTRNPDWTSSGMPRR